MLKSRIFLILNNIKIIERFKQSIVLLINTNLGGIFMFERFTERALQVIMMSQEESRRLGHNFVGTEQILLGLLGEGCGVTTNAVREYGITIRKVRIEVERLIGKGTGFVAIEIPFTPRAKKVLEMSIKQSKELNHSYITVSYTHLTLPTKA